MKNLTAGSIRPQLISLALPLIMGNILQQFYNTVDALVVGRYAGAAAFAAIGVSGTVMNLFLFVINGFCTGIAIILAQFYGCNDWRNFRREYFTSLISGILFTASISGLGIVFLFPVLRLIRTPGEVAVLAHTYLTIIFWGLAAAFLYNFCSAVLRAAGDTMAALLFLAASVGSNLVLDLLFVAVLHMGIAGAAWATILSQGISVLLCFIYMKHRAPELLLKKEDIAMDIPLLKRTWSYCCVTALHQSSVYIGKILVQGTVNSLGTEAIAAYTAAGRIEGFANSFGDSGSASVSVFIAQNVGNGGRERARKGFLNGTAMLIGLGLVSSCAMYLTAPAAMSLMLGSAGTPAFLQGTGYLKTVACFYILCFAGNGLVGYFEGNGRVIIPILGAVMHLGLRVILSWIFAPRYGLYAVAAATGTGWLLAVTLWWGIYMVSDRRARGSSMAG